MKTVIQAAEGRKVSMPLSAGTPSAPTHDEIMEEILAAAGLEKQP